MLAHYRYQRTLPLPAHTSPPPRRAGLFTSVSPMKGRVIMESIPQASKRHLAAGSARRRGRALAGVAATIGLLTAPAVAAASPRPVLQAPVLSVPPLCHKVSSSAVSGVVGYPVTLFF